MAIHTKTRKRFGQHFDGEVPRNSNHIFLRLFEHGFNKKIGTFSPLHPYIHRTQIGLGALVWQPQPSFSISDRSCLMAEKSRQNASRIARRKMKTGCELHGERERKKKRGKSDQAWPNRKDSQMLPIWTVRHGASGADRIRHYYNREGAVKS